MTETRCVRCINFSGGECRFEAALDVTISNAKGEAAMLDSQAEDYQAQLLDLALYVQGQLFEFREEARGNKCTSPRINDDPDYPGKNLL